MGEPTLLPCPFCGSRGEWYGPSVGCSSDTCPALLVPAKGVERAEEAWNRRAPNPLAAALAACDERIRELEAEAQRLRERVAELEEALMSAVDVEIPFGLGKLKANVITAARLISAAAAEDLAKRDELERQNAELRGEIESLAASTFGQERVSMAAHVATLERELAEERPIVQAARLYYQAELAGNEKGMLAGLRAIQAAFERGTIADHARRMAPAEEPREVVEPAPAPVRYRCEGCGWEGEAADLATSDGHIAIVQDANGDPEPNLCGPCVPVTDAQPAGAAP